MPDRDLAIAEHVRFLALPGAGDVVSQLETDVSRIVRAGAESGKRRQRA